MAVAGPRILIVEDDEEIASAIARALTREGYATAQADSVAGALEATQSEHWDAVLLDLGLPDGDGLEVARAVRAAGGTPVLVVTARDEVSSRVEGLDAGADDYLVKPFDRLELLARLRALLRRSAPAAGAAPIAIDDLIVDQVHRSVRRGTRVVQTTPLEFELLAYLGRRPGTPVSREELLENVWHHDPSEPTNTVEVFVSNLRRKLEAGGESRILRTVRGSGYALGA
ncbi:MAG: response regulator transcription factor [Solirubrobacteraceae bacterium]|nr:response regulator transcription factor [Solirubrobacteraceae bacterium]